MSKPTGWKREAGSSWAHWYTVKYSHHSTGARIYFVEDTEAWQLYWTDSAGNEWRVKTETLKAAFEVWSSILGK